MTLDEEKMLIESFMELYKAFPKGTIVKMNPPPAAADYLLTTQSGEKIGIELREVFHKGEAKRISSTTYKFTNLVLEKLKSQLPFSFSIDIDLDIQEGIPKPMMNDIVNNTIDFCKKEFADLMDYEFREVINIDFDLSEIDKNIKGMILSSGYRNLPRGIEKIAIFRYDNVSESWNSQGEGGPVPHFTDEYLTDILKKKEEKLRKYKPCNQFWLVIKEGNYYSGGFHDIEISIPVSSSYHKIFICRISKQEVIELK
jgi:hypothetical protein